ncbi:MAG: glycerophosphodiester phosphodiesterase [Streptosporangiales bacterium]|nr:glycerophosphodiester phosphodiesterase [Streptosporangiales bacterium]
MAAFEHAVGLGFRYLETDVHATADGVVVVFHDHTLDRVTDMTGRIAEQPWSVVSRARIGGTEPILRLDELTAAWPDVRINVDVKEDAAVEPFVDTVRRTGALDRICVASFSDRRLRRVRAALGDRLCTSTGPAEIARLRLAAYGPLLRAAVPRRAGCVQVPVQAYALPIVTRGFVDTAHAAGLQVHVWTVNTRTEMERLLEIGVDGLISDELDTLRTVLTDRGTWVPHADHP